MRRAGALRVGDGFTLGLILGGGIRVAALHEPVLAMAIEAIGAAGGRFAPLALKVNLG